jgi:uncharacterized repeat protein (TIGR01451 family)
MKKLFKRALSALLCLLMVCGVVAVGGTVSASAETDGDFTYTVADGVATITDVSTSISGAVTIPSTLGGYPVTRIGERAFYDCRSLTSVTIPDSVTSIGSYAFRSCTSLTSIDVENDNPNYASIDGVLFNKALTQLITSLDGKQGAYTIPDSVTSIGNYAFYNCTKLTSVTIPNSVTNIGSNAFSRCTSLTAYVYEDSYAEQYCIDNSISYEYPLPTYPTALEQYLPSVYADYFAQTEVDITALPLDVVEWTAPTYNHSAENGLGWDTRAYTEARSKQYNGIATSNHMVFDNATDTIRFLGTDVQAIMDIAFTDDSVDGFSSMAFTLRPIVMNFHTFRESAFLFNGTFTGNKYTGYAIILENTHGYGTSSGYSSSGVGKGDAILSVFYLENETFSNSNFNPGKITSTRTLLGVIKDDIKQLSTAPFEIEINKYSDGGYDVSVDGKVCVEIVSPKNDGSGYGFYTGYYLHSCSVLTVMAFENISIMQPSRPGGPARTEVTVKFLDKTNNNKVAKTLTRPWNLADHEKIYVGDQYKVIPPENINGYTYVGSNKDNLDRLTYQANADDNVVELYYEKKYTVSKTASVNGTADNGTADSPAPVAVGDTIDYCVDVYNPYDSTVTAAYTLTDLLPEGLSAVTSGGEPIYFVTADDDVSSVDLGEISATVTETDGREQISFSFSQLPAGIVRFRFHAQVTALGYFENTATLSVPGKDSIVSEPTYHSSYEQFYVTENYRAYSAPGLGNMALKPATSQAFSAYAEVQGYSPYPQYLQSFTDTNGDTWKYWGYQRLAGDRHAGDAEPVRGPAPNGQDPDTHSDEYDPQNGWAWTDIDENLDIVFLYVKDVSVNVDYKAVSNPTGANLKATYTKAGASGLVEYNLPASHTAPFDEWIYAGQYSLDGGTTILSGSPPVPTFTDEQMVSDKHIVLYFEELPPASYAVTVQFREYKDTESGRQNGQLLFDANGQSKLVLASDGAAFDPSQYTAVTNAVTGGVSNVVGKAYPTYEGWSDNGGAAFHAGALPAFNGLDADKTIVLYFSTNYTIAEAFHANVAPYDELAAEAATTFSGGETFTGNPPLSIDDGEYIWEYIGYKLATDQNSLVEYGTDDYVAPVVQDIAGDETVIYVYRSIVWDEWVITTPATCEEDGEQKRINKNNPTHVETEVIPATGHDYQAQVTLPTCTEGGYTTYVCTHDHSHTYVADETEPTGHDWGEWEIVTPATCEEDGEKKRVCANDESHIETAVIPATGHDYQAQVTLPTCTEGGYTTYVCAHDNSHTYVADETPATGHDWGDWEVVTPATCEEDGEMKRVCNNNASHVETVVIPATDHDYQPTETIPPTYTSQGYTWYVCTHDASHKYQADWTGILALPTYTATFVNEDGQTVAQVVFEMGQTALSEPGVPGKDGYAGAWEAYTLNDENITIHPVYKRIAGDDVSDIVNEKTADYTNGIARITLSAKAPTAQVKLKTDAQPLDIVLVVDQSLSMDMYKIGSKTRTQVLKDAATNFINNVYANAAETGADHRISVVGFGYASGGSYVGSEILSTKNGTAVKYPGTAANYKDSLVSVNANGAVNSILTKAISNIGAKGATAAEMGLVMASNVFGNTDGDGRKRLVVFLTDGEPTYTGTTFDTAVANAAIDEARKLKNISNAPTIYSLAITDSTAANFMNFLRYVSSGYPAATSMTQAGTGNDDYFVTVNDQAKLNGIFDDILMRDVVKSVGFRNVTIRDTISSAFTLTTEQETALRNDLHSTYGLSDSQIQIVRNADGTTTLTIAGLTPKWDGSQYYTAEVSFDVSANAQTISGGTYATNTSDAAILLPDGSDTVQAQFDIPQVTIPAGRQIVVFKIGDDVYAIREYIGGELIAPETDLATWDLSAITEDVTIFEAELETPTYTVTWIVGGETVKTEAVQYGAAIPAYTPTLPEGQLFLNWSPSVPAKMPNRDMTFIATVQAHTHNFKTASISGTCEDGQVELQICACGETKTVPHAAAAHNYTTRVGEDTDGSVAYFTCETCGYSYEKRLDYKYENATYNYYGYTLPKYQLSLKDGEVAVQPDGTIKITIPMPAGGSVWAVPKIYRANEDGTLTALPTEVTGGGLYLTFTTDHFSTYVIGDESVISNAPAEAAEALATAKSTKKAAINAADDAYKQADYTPESWAALQSAIANALAAVDNAATVDAVNAVSVPNAASILKTPAVVDKSALTARINEVKNTAQTTASGKYTDASWNAFQTALTGAQQTASNANATQAQVTAALNALNTAYNNLTLARGIFGTAPKWYGAWWHYLLFFLCFGFIWMWF